MRRSVSLCLLTAVLTMSGCASSEMQYVQQTPPLDSSLSAPCDKLTEPEQDYDAITEWAIDVVGKYYKCSLKHRKVVESWQSTN